MKTQLTFLFLVLSLAINVSHAKQITPFSDFAAIDQFISKAQQWLTKQITPFSEFGAIDQFINNAQQWLRRNQAEFQQSQLLITPPILVAGGLCFIAASLTSAGGIGGGGIYIPILTIVAGLDLKTASILSAFMVTGGSVANVLSNFRSKRSKLGLGEKNLINFDIALLTQPCLLLGVSIGVICNLWFPEWVITSLFAVFLAWSTIKTCGSGMLCWKLESEELGNNRVETLEDRTSNEDQEQTLQEPLLPAEHAELGVPLMKLGALALVWFSFILIYLLRGTRFDRGLLPIEVCGVGYWALSSLQLPMAIASTIWIICKQVGPQPDSSPQKDLEEEQPAVEASKKLMFSLMGLLAGISGGMFGIGGGMVISPFLLQVGVLPKVTAATCSLMVFFSATMSVSQYLLLGIEHGELAVIFAAVCFVGSVVGLAVAQKARRASLIIFSLSIVMALSSVVTTTFGALIVLSDYKAGKHMGFRSAC